MNSDSQLLNFAVYSISCIQLSQAEYEPQKQQCDDDASSREYKVPINRGLVHKVVEEPLVRTEI